MLISIDMFPSDRYVDVITMTKRCNYDVYANIVEEYFAVVVYE